MPKNLNKVAKEYQKLGLNPVPLLESSKPMSGRPVREDWGSPIGNVDDYDFEEIGICTGSVSGGLEVIDFDIDVLSQEEADKLWSDWKGRLPNSILKKLVVSRTKSGGYHVIYRCSLLDSNKKLALKEMPDGKFKTLIETRGDGGYIRCHPSEGYEIIYGSLDNIQLIEDWERNALITGAKMFDEKGIKKKKKSNKDFEDPFPEYNEDPDIGIELLENHGWEILKEGDLWIEMKRPGKRREGISAGYNLDGNFLFVWSTNTEFEIETPYSNSAIYAILEHDGDFKKAYRQLRKDGWGKEQDSTSDSEDKDSDKEDWSFLSRPGEDEKKLEQARKGEVELGKSFGWPSLDPYLLYKSNTLNLTLAYEGVGKTFLVLHKLASLAVQYGYKFSICCGENDVDTVKRYLVEAISGKGIRYFDKRGKEYQVYLDFMYAHFYIFRNKKHYSVEDVMERASMVQAKFGTEGLFIDPFSYFKKPFANSYQYADDLLSKMNIYAHNEQTIFMSVHPVTDATRAPKDAEGYMKAPTRYDAIGGNMFANRSDQFFVYHRIKNHKVKEMRKFVEIRVEKIKEYETGGSETAADEGVNLKFETKSGWRGYFDGNVNPIMKINGSSISEHDNIRDIPKGNLKDAF